MLIIKLLLQTIDWWKGEIKDLIREEACTRIDDVIHSERELTSLPINLKLFS